MPRACAAATARFMRSRRARSWSAASAPAARRRRQPSTSRPSAIFPTARPSSARSRRSSHPPVTVAFCSISMPRRLATPRAWRKPSTATSALRPGQVRVRGPVDPARRVPFLAQLLDVDVTPDRPPAEVVIDAQSGTVVMGEDVKLTSAAVAYGNLSIAIAETPQVAQPLPFSNTGTTQVVPRTQITAEEKTAKILEIRPAPKISDVVRNLNAIGASSSDLIAILQALRSAGALHAHLKVL